MNDRDEEILTRILEQGMSRRRMLQRMAQAGLVVAGATIIPVACSSQSGSGTSTGSATGGKSKRDTLTVAAPETPAGVDWDAYVGITAQECFLNLYNTALAWAMKPVEGQPNMMTADYSKLEPQLADDWEFSNGGRTITLKFKKGIMSHAGNELTSADFLYTRERSLGLAAIGTFLLSAQGITSKNDVKVVDRYTVQVTSSQGANPLLADCNTNQYFNLFDSTEMKKHATGSDPWSSQWVKTHSAGFGPYKLQSVEQGTGMTWVAHDEYWAGAPPIKTIIHKEVPESANRLALIANGSVDIAQELGPRQLSSLKSNPRVTVYSAPSTLEAFIGINAGHKPFDNVMVRQAMSYAFPYSEVLKNVYLGLARPILAPFPSVVPGYADISPYKSEDLGKAKSLLQQAGYASGFATTLTYDLASPESEQAALLYQANLKQIGVTLNFDKQPSAALAEHYTKEQYELLLRSDGPIQPDINYALSLFFETQTKLRQCCDLSNYSNPEVDRALDQGRSILDKSQRIAFHQPIMRTIMHDAPHIWVADTGFNLAAKKEIAGVNHYSLYTMLFNRLTVT